MTFVISVAVTLFSDRFCTYELIAKKVYQLSTEESPRGYIREMNDSSSSNYTFWYIDGDRVKGLTISTDHFGITGHKSTQSEIYKVKEPTVISGGATLNILHINIEYVIYKAKYVKKLQKFIKKYYNYLFIML